ncbi:DUF397 domain-containing protein [Streptomyces tsukubensis]|uniref:DUF397 domain-containing protein n=1 Tax=Streptomyces tsukubensis TaxID=83656 RepID=UPI00098ECACB|nr:DUF397 domain-containing protein [Streptomyces tsukubensis]QFR92921.1 DUF397 domain-containing protein [Streptomyces tsukubensis]
MGGEGAGWAGRRRGAALTGRSPEEPHARLYARPRVEVGQGVSRVVPVRDSKVANGPIVTVTSATWTSFVTAVRVGI